MPTKKAHLELARRNGAMLAHLMERLDQFPEWATTVAFYRALHFVEAAFYIDDAIRHGGDHGAKIRHLKTNKKYRKIYEAYRPLWAASLIARYLENDQEDASVSCFADYLTPTAVKERIIDHYLNRVEASVEQLLGEPLDRLPT